MSDPSQAEKAARFAALHRGDPFVIPNPWDAGSAKVLAALGFEALATTSAGLAFTLGRPDGGATLDEVVEHVRAIAGATHLPVSVDLENGYADEPEGVGEAIASVAQAGAVGASIEDWDPAGRIYPIEQAVERICAAREAADRTGFEFTLTGRAENYLREHPHLDDTIARLQAYERAGADVLYAPRLPGLDEIRALHASVSKPLNVLAQPNLTMAEIVAAGGQRISVGGTLTWTAVNAMADAAQRMLDGDFSGLGDRRPVERWLAGNG